MAKSNVIQIVKKEPSEKEKELSRFVESVENLQDFLTPIGKQAELWSIFENLMFYVGACMRESVSKNPKGEKKGGAI